MARRDPPAPPPLPTKRQILEFLRDNPNATNKREIARAFHVRGEEPRQALKVLLREMEQDGSLARVAAVERRVRVDKKGRATGAHLPEVAVLEVIEIDADGDALARPAVWDSERPPPRIVIDPEGSRGAPAIGDRVLARLTRAGARMTIAKVIRILPPAQAKLIGVFEKAESGGWLRPTDRKDREDYRIPTGDTGDAQHGELVLAELLPSGGMNRRTARIVERLGPMGAPRSISLIAIHGHDIPNEFAADVLAEAEDAKPVTPDNRTDLRDVPLVTIDGSDARDFDDAVFAEPDTDKENAGGFHLLVAIADVAHYVKPDSALDRSARDRGNSVYFPDRVVPMLPEALSNGLCSLKPHEERACMAVHIWIDNEGRKISHRFVRGIMRSTARLTYEQAEAAHQGRTDETTAPLKDTVIAPLYAAYAALAKARIKRGTLDLDLPERRVVVSPDGTVAGIAARERLDSHRLIEEFMILANVCAAETLEATKQPCMYRLHDQPSDEKIAALRDFLASLNLSLPKGQVVQPRHFMQVLRKAHGLPQSTLVSEVVLRSQAQAEYGPDNIGHFGLALRRYAHFTSPIRRYADLLVHRGLIRGLKLGTDGLPEGMGIKEFADVGQHISGTERRAALAEREVVDRYTAAYLASHVGAQFVGRVSGVGRFGLFVKLIESGADGLLPMRALPADYYIHDETHHRLIGERNGHAFALGDTMEVELALADTITGSLQFAYVSGGTVIPAGERKVPHHTRSPRGRGNRPYGPRKGGKPTKRRR